MNITEVLSGCEFENKEMWIGEANFGFRYLAPFADGLAEGASVLEVGSGSGILLTMLKERNPHIQIEGIEPFASGFDQLEALNAFVRESGAAIRRTGYEDFWPEKKYELIYLVNVFEHLEDWAHFLGFVRDSLSEYGVCVILCPNYGLPYESHFKIPIVFNKHTTGALFSNYINRFEKSNNVIGLWESLNFVKLSQVKKAVGRLGLELKVNNRITNDLIERLSTDAEFRERQRVIGLIGRIAKTLGLTWLFRSRLVENFQPYMMLEIRLKAL